jgi:hypothetical protein
LEKKEGKIALRIPAGELSPTHLPVVIMLHDQLNDVLGNGYGLPLLISQLAIHLKQAFLP